jgi:hypothetical protein
MPAAYDNDGDYLHAAQAAGYAVGLQSVTPQ